jgi:hypothetical protein
MTDLHRHIRAKIRQLQAEERRGDRPGRVSPSRTGVFCAPITFCLNSLVLQRSIRTMSGITLLLVFVSLYALLIVLMVLFARQTGR